MITIPVSATQTARKFLTRIHFERLKLPVLTHVLATVDATGLSLAVTDLDHWLETRLPEGTRFLIPAAALAAAARGDKGGRVTVVDPLSPGNLKLSFICGGMPSETVYQPEPAADFPERPKVEGSIVKVPKETMMALQTVAGCASTDTTRYVLNGVLFSPDGGGTLVATDGRRLAGAPARFSGTEFILPNSAVHVLAFPDFAPNGAEIQQAEKPEPRVRFDSGPYTLIAKTIEGCYPNYRQVIPDNFLSHVTIPDSLKPGLIRWLRSLEGKSGRKTSVRLAWNKPNHLTLISMDSDTTGACIHVPARITGKPPTISFGPKYLADALEIGLNLQFSDGLSPAMAIGTCGNFCVLMPWRCAAGEPEGVDA